MVKNYTALNMASDCVHEPNLQIISVNHSIITINPLYQQTEQEKGT